MIVTMVDLFIADSMPVRGAFFGSGSGQIILDNIVCIGTESSLLECHSNPIGENNCNHSEDAGVKCEGMPESNYLTTLIAFLYTYVNNTYMCI